MLDDTGSAGEANKDMLKNFVDALQAMGDATRKFSNNPNLTAEQIGYDMTNSIKPEAYRIVRSLSVFNCIMFQCRSTLKNPTFIKNKISIT